MTRTIEAFYENGILLPLELRQYPLADLIGTLPDEDSREMMQAIEEEFERIDADEWK